MAKYYYKKSRDYRLHIKFILLGIVVLGGIIFSYTFFPLISWQVYFAPALAASKIQTPIPQDNVISPTSIESLITSAANNVGADYTNAYNWYPQIQEVKKEY